MVERIKDGKLRRKIKRANGPFHLGFIFEEMNNTPMAHTAMGVTLDVYIRKAGID